MKIEWRNINMVSHIIHCDNFCDMFLDITNRLSYRLCPFHSYCPLRCDYSILYWFFDVPTLFARFCPKQIKFNPDIPGFVRNQSHASFYRHIGVTRTVSKRVKHLHFLRSVLSHFKIVGWHKMISDVWKKLPYFALFPADNSWSLFIRVRSYI